MNCGRPGFSPATLANMDRRRDMRPRRSGAGHGMQDPRPGGGEAAQSAILPGTARSRFCGKDGRGAVRLSPGENPQAGGARVEGEEKAERRGGAPSQRLHVAAGKESPKEGGRSRGLNLQGGGVSGHGAKPRVGDAQESRLGLVRNGPPEYSVRATMLFGLPRSG
jgi:hypothetical protein